MLQRRGCIIIALGPTRLPEEHQALTSALKAGMVIASVLLPLLLWALNRKAYAGSVLRGIVFF